MERNFCDCCGEELFVKEKIIFAYDEEHGGRTLQEFYLCDKCSDKLRTQCREILVNYKNFANSQFKKLSERFCK